MTMNASNNTIKNIPGYDWVVQDADLLGGQPTVKDTRLSVAFVLESLAVGYTPDEMAKDYPGFPPACVPDVLRFAAEFMKKKSGNGHVAA